MSHTQCMRLDRGLIVEIVVMVKCGGQVLNNTPWKMTTRLVGKKTCGDWTGKELLQTKTKRSIAHQEVPKFQPESGP